MWRKLHLAVDPATHDIVAAQISLENVQDTEVLPTLLNPLRHKLNHTYADGAYHSRANYQLITRKVATACIPPRKNAGLWKKGHPGAGDAQGRADSLKEDVGVSPSLADRDGNVALQAVDDGKNQSA